ncbi:Bug family tripartite tricarboxylate transporter substrate binding protein [Hydrogenophaga pseudoflava]|uniref:Bug family tripartite tricarboxylate transporter substrate binding protein n=1 Tax=Hydrogenophaga pseudoflava TaxID=47421 RepID=UPI0027E5A17A|nr:tripartite tricarboxylate transporter substrate binding protein [Hydrogenophaga pseudoflava]MDQ7742945.1 tripartite tricarboxylate transporter substrate binding protein [Hydrogenophaga pseudoflava]
MNNRHLSRRQWVAAATAGMATLWMSAPAWAQSWPDRPIKLVVPYPAGGAADQTARLIAGPLGERLKTTVVVDNRPGGGGSIGAAAVAKAAPDGYTLLLDATGFTVNPALLPKMPFDPVKDLQPVSLVMQVPMLLVVPAGSPHKTVADLIQAARSQPGKLSFASAGNGSAQHLTGELFKQGHKLFITHIPYRGGAPALSDLMGGQVDMMFSAMPASLPLVRSGKLRALAVTAPQRAELVGAIPTVAETGLKGFAAQEWNGIWAPTGTPPDVMGRLETELRAVMALPEVRQRLAANGAVAMGTPRADFGKFVQTEMAQWARVIQQAGIKLD